MSFFLLIKNDNNSFKKVVLERLSKDTSYSLKWKFYFNDLPCIAIDETGRVGYRNEFGPESFRDAALRLNVAMKEEL